MLIQSNHEQNNSIPRKPDYCNEDEDDADDQLQPFDKFFLHLKQFQTNKVRQIQKEFLIMNNASWNPLRKIVFNLKSPWIYSGLRLLIYGIAQARQTRSRLLF